MSSLMRIVCIFVDQYHYFISIRCQFRSSCKALQDKHEPHRLCRDYAAE